MLVAMCVAAALAGVIHILFFCMESLWWTKPNIRQNFGLSEQDAQTTKLLAYNQGFYNLFLAIGTFVGQGMYYGGLKIQGATLVTFTCACMLTAALVLASSSPRMIRGAMIQALFPAIFLVLGAIRVLG